MAHATQYGAEYRVISSDSPQGALDLLKGLKVRNYGVALLLADQRMPQPAAARPTNARTATCGQVCEQYGTLMRDMWLLTHTQQK